MKTKQDCFKELFETVKITQSVF